MQVLDRKPGQMEKVCLQLSYYDSYVCIYAAFLFLGDILLGLFNMVLPPINQKRSILLFLIIVCGVGSFLLRLLATFARQNGRND